MLIAGTFGAAATSAVAEPKLDSIMTADSSLTLSHRRLRVMLREVRHARSALQRTQAFARCKAALRLHDLAQTANAAPAGTFALYRHPDPSATLARVIVRELDAMPASDPAWLARLGDLEALFRAEA